MKITIEFTDILLKEAKQDAEPFSASIELPDVSNFQALFEAFKRCAIGIGYQPSTVEEYE